MKKITLTLVIFILSVLGIKAQITLGSGDFPYAGLKVDYFVANDSSGGLTSLINLGSPGAGGVYNITGVSNHINGSMVMDWRDPANTPFPTQHPTSNVGALGKPFLIFGDTAMWPWAYFNSSATGLVLNGTSIILDTSYFSHLVHGPLQYFTPTVSNNLECMSSNYALGYSHRDSLKAKIILQGSSPLVIAYKIDLDVAIDGWGTLTTPLGVYSVLRAIQIGSHSEAYLLPQDTLTNWTYQETETFYQYIYYAKGIGSPLAIVNMDSTFTDVLTVRYANKLPAGINENAGNTYLNIYPNPANSELNINLNVSAKSGYCRIYDVLGTEVIKNTFTGNNLKVDISNLAKGMYILKAETSEGVTVMKFDKE